MKSRDANIAIIVALIGLCGVLGAALINNWGVIFPSQPTFVPPTQNPPTISPSNSTSATVKLFFMANESGQVTNFGNVYTGLDHAPRAGDYNNNEIVRGFISFDLTEIDDNAEINSATLKFVKSTETGAEFPNFGALRFEFLYYGLSLTKEAYDIPAEALILETYNEPTMIDVTDALRRAKRQGYPRFQIRFSFSTGTDNDDKGEVYWIPVHDTAGVPVLTVTYNVPK